MDRIPLIEIAKMAGAKIIQGSPDILVSTISKDSRTIQPGDLYIALRGDNFDGNAYASDALARGAVAVLLDSADVAASISAPHAVLLAAQVSHLKAVMRIRQDIVAAGFTPSADLAEPADLDRAEAVLREHALR